ncbi:smalltalk protein [Bacteroides ihuae]|nr:smalltalk protein [Bacteroides ihuae]
MKKSTWDLILKIIIAVVGAIGGALGAQAMTL